MSGATITLAYKRWHCVEQQHRGNSVESAWTKGSRAVHFPPTVHYYIDFTTQPKVHHHSSKHEVTAAKPALNHIKC